MIDQQWQNDKQVHAKLKTRETITPFSYFSSFLSSILSFFLPFLLLIFLPSFLSSFLFSFLPSFLPSSPSSFLNDNRARCLLFQTAWWLETGGSSLPWWSLSRQSWTLKQEQLLTISLQTHCLLESRSESLSLQIKIQSRCRQFFCFSNLIH